MPPLPFLANGPPRRGRHAQPKQGRRPALPTEHLQAGFMQVGGVARGSTGPKPPRSQQQVDPGCAQALDFVQASLADYQPNPQVIKSRLNLAVYKSRE